MIGDEPPGWVDPLDRKVSEHFAGRVVRKDLVQRLKVGFSVPVYVLEYLLGQYCSTTDEDEIAAGLELVKEMIAERIVRADQGELIKARLQRFRSMKLIDLVTVTFDEKDQGGKYWARLATCGLDKIHIDERLTHQYERMFTGGVWANVELAYDESIVHGGVTRPFVLRRMQPIQIAGAELEEYVQARRHFSREEWVDALLRTVGYEPTHPDITWRRKLLYLLRLVSLVEKNYNLVELGPKETGKSFAFREISPYANLLSGGQGSATDLFGWKNRRDKPGLVVRYDVVAFDEVAGPNFRSSRDKDMYKGYMEQGSFSRGDDKGTISAEAGIVFNGNIKGDIAVLVKTGHLLSPLPEQIRDDDAFHDRWHAYLPGWEMPKLVPSLFTAHLGFVADYIAEIFHNALRPLNYTDLCERDFAFGAALGHRDRKAVMRTVSGLVKLIHPGGEVRKEEMAEYLRFAVEMRRRVKEQLRRMNPDEFKSAELGYIDKQTGTEYRVSCPEMGPTDRSGDQALQSGETPERGGPDVSRGDAPARRIEVFHGYELLQALPAGGMAEAFRARTVATGEVVFLKRVRTASSDREALERESRIYEKLMRAQCRHVVRIIDFVRNTEYVALVTEFADAGDLERHIHEKARGSDLTPTDAKEIGLEVATAVEELHRHEIVHRDLKPANVLRAGGQWKLADFGISKNLARLITQRTFQLHGTPGYAAPEQFEGCAAHPSADIYSFGKLLVFLLSGQTDVDRIAYPHWREMICRCISADPEHRPAIRAVIQELRTIRV